MIFVRRGNLLLILLIVLGLGLPACHRGETGEAVSPLQSPLMIPLATASPIPPPPLDVPTPSPGLGVVRGQLVAVTPSARAFLAGEVYLAPLIYTQGTTPMPFVRLKPGEDPRASLRNEANEFAIVDVPPGKYGIVLHTPATDYVVPAGQGNFLLVEVKGGEVLDLGVIELR